MVATPIGNPSDISLRALTLLKDADLVIGEELKELRQILKAAGVQARKLDQLNEHSRPADIEHFVTAAREGLVALVSDCGTPGFCDPGADLVRACAAAGIAVHAVPGASSLMALLSVCGARVDEFVFAGFLSPKSELRAAAWSRLKKESRPIILMETPYRAEKWASELREHFAERFLVLAFNLTQETERVLRVFGRDLAKHGPFAAGEPIVLIMPAGWRP